MQTATAAPNDPQKQNLKDTWDYNLTNHKPTVDGIRKIEVMRTTAKAMAHAIIDICPAGRDQALALTSLEQMLFHANAAIARNMNEDLTPPDDTPEEDKALKNDQTKSAEEK